jgi:hypothetical protein
MSRLITNLPAVKVWVRKEYLCDHKYGHGEFIEGVWVSAKSIPGRAFYFETYLPDYAAMYDKLPISAFVSRPETPDPDLDLPNLQFWNCMDYNVTTICKQIVASMEWECRTRHFGIIKGEYICTLDNYHGDIDTIDASTSELPDEHKSFNLIALENGQYALYPNNRCRIFDISMTPQEAKIPDFKVSTKLYQVENGIIWGRLGDCTDYFWTTPEEREEYPQQQINNKNEENNG